MTYSRIIILTLLNQPNATTSSNKKWIQWPWLLWHTSEKLRLRLRMQFWISKLQRIDKTLERVLYQLLITGWVTSSIMESVLDLPTPRLQAIQWEHHLFKSLSEISSSISMKTTSLEHLKSSLPDNIFPQQLNSVLLFLFHFMLSQLSSLL